MKALGQGHSLLPQNANSMWSEVLIYNKVTCVKASYIKSPLGSLEFRHVSLSMWGFAICYSHWSLHKVRLNLNWINNSLFKPPNLLLIQTRLLCNVEQNIPRTVRTTVEIAEHLKQCQYFMWHLAAFWSTFTWGREVIFISGPSFHTACSSLKVKINTKRERGVRLEQ